MANRTSALPSGGRLLVNQLLGECRSLVVGRLAGELRGEVGDQLRVDARVLRGSKMTERFFAVGRETDHEHEQIGALGMRVVGALGERPCVAVAPGLQVERHEQIDQLRPLHRVELLDDCDRAVDLAKLSEHDGLQATGFRVVGRGLRGSLDVRLGFLRPIHLKQETRQFKPHRCVVGLQFEIRFVACGSSARLLHPRAGPSAQQKCVGLACAESLDGVVERDLRLGPVSAGEQRLAPHIRQLTALTRAAEHLREQLVDFRPDRGAILRLGVNDARHRVVDQERKCGAHGRHDAQHVERRAAERGLGDGTKCVACAVGLARELVQPGAGELQSRVFAVFRETRVDERTGPRDAVAQELVGVDAFRNGRHRGEQVDHAEQLTDGLWAIGNARLEISHHRLGRPRTA